MPPNDTGYEDRISIPCNTGNKETEFFSPTGLLLAKGYERIVIGKRGPYVEFSDEQIAWNRFSIPKEEEYRIDSKVVFYVGYCSHGDSNVKLYHQKKNVIYADYRIGMNYISPFELYIEDGKVLIKPLRKKQSLNSRQQGLFGL